MKIKTLLSIAAMFAATMMFTSCDDDNDDVDSSAEKEEFFANINKDLVNKTIIPIYTNLKDSNADLLDAINKLQEPDAQQDDVDDACEAWKAARKYWEQSESFLYGPATDFGIDPHTDTWPFDRTAFDNYIRRYPDLAEDEDAQAIVAEAIATGQSLTGFHAVEYLLFRNGSPRNIEDITNNELWFCAKAAEDLYLASVKLVSAWGGEITEDEEALLEEAEFESRNYGENMINAGKAGSTYTSVTLGTIQILEGCQDIIDEVAHSKIGHPYTGEDKNYIESPHAYNSIQDFYDNVLSCAFALNGGANKINNYTANSVMAYASAHYPEEANNVKQALEDALDAIDNMKRPFVTYYQDQSAGKAIEALEALDDAIDKLKEKLED